MRFDGSPMRGERIALEPLTVGHAADFLVYADERAFRYSIFAPASWDAAGFEAFVRHAISMPGRVAYAIVDAASGRAVGSTSYLDIQPENLAVEVGFTWIAASLRGTRVNPESKLLMLGNAFDGQGAQRVQLKCDLRNEQSQRAIAKLGAAREGVLRHNRILADGHRRDTVVFSILREEWPGVRAGLEARLRAAE